MQPMPLDCNVDKIPNRRVISSFALITSITPCQMTQHLTSDLCANALGPQFGRFGVYTLVRCRHACVDMIVRLQSIRYFHSKEGRMENPPAKCSMFKSPKS